MNNENQLPIADSSQVTTYLWSILRGRRLALVGVLGIFLAEAATALVVPLFIGRIVDMLNEQGSQQIPAGFSLMLLAIIGAALLAGLLAWLGGVGIARVTETTITDIREDYVGAALNLPRAQVETAGTGDVVTRASDDIAEISGTLPDVLPRFFVSLFTVLVIAGTITTIDWRFMLIFLAMVPVYVMTVRWYLRTAPPVYQTQRAVESVRGQHILGTLDNLDTVRAHQLGEHQWARISESSWSKVRWAMRTRLVQNRMFGRLNIIQGIGMGAILGAGVWLAFSGSITPGAVAAAALLFQRIIGPINGLMYVMDDFQEALSSLGRIIGVIALPAQKASADSDASTDNISPASRTDAQELVRIRNLDFGYTAGYPVLKDINLDIAPGESIAVVGATGSGKSTLASLIAGVYEPTSGAIDRSIAAEDIYSLSQETHVFMGTVRSNLTLAKPDATDEEIGAALRNTGAESFIAALPEGLDTAVGHSARHLEPAQAQHVALARLSLLNPPLVILDEATADADSADADALDRASLAITRNSAAIVIAHRLSQAARCDRVLVMDHGEIIESGSHDELLDADGSYARLWQAWSTGARATEEQEARTPG